MKPSRPSLAFTLPSLAAAALLAALSAPFALAQSADNRPDPARGEDRGAARDIQNGDTRPTGLLLPAVQKAREAAEDDGPAQADVSGEPAAGDVIVGAGAGAGPQSQQTPRRAILHPRRQGGDQ